MTRHSKNCTAGAFFTSAEREKLAQYGTQRERLGRDSLRTPVACVLCLREPACDAVACPGGGHVFCRECLLTHLVACRRARERTLAEEERRRMAGERVAVEEEEARQRERVAAFTSINRPGGAKRAKAETTAKTGTTDISASPAASAFGPPERTPAVARSSTSSSGSTKTVVYCPAATGRDHTINMKQVIPINWTLSTKGDGAAICSVCTNGLQMATAGLVLVRSCGHVFCSKCIGNIAGGSGDGGQPGPKGDAASMDKLQSCPGCSQPVTGTLRLAGEGSGFAGGSSLPGQLEVKKYDPAFI